MGADRAPVALAARCLVSLLAPPSHFEAVCFITYENMQSAIGYAKIYV